MRSVAVASFLYDPINLITVDAQIAPYVVSEQDLLVEHLKYVKAGDILLLDRGYPSMSLFYRLGALGVDFCVRMKEDSWKAVKAFGASGKRDAMIKYYPTRKRRPPFGGLSPDGRAQASVETRAGPA